MSIDPDETEKILERIDWRYAIAPSGGLATQPCFALREMPTVQRLSADQSRTCLVTQSTWTANLVESDAIWNLNDDSTMHAVSECFLIFHAAQKPRHKSLHLLHFDTHAWFAVNNILRPTIKFQKALDNVVGLWPNDPSGAWQELCRVWYEFGFLWPQKIVLGHKIHVQRKYKSTGTDQDRIYRLRLSRDEAYAQMETKLAAKRAEGEQQQQGDTKKEDTSQWTIIKRNDVRPIYEFLPAPTRDTIREMIRMFVHRIPVHHPVKLRNLCTSSYLSWRIAGNNNNNNNNNKRDTGKGKSNRDEKPQVLFATTPAEHANTSQSQYLWRFEWNTRRTEPSAFHLETLYEPEHIRCGSHVYLYPACETPMNEHRPALSSDAMILTRTSAQTTSLSDSPQQQTTRLRGIELIDPQNQNDMQPHRWTVEMPGLGLGKDDEASTDMGMNVDIDIGRRKHVLHCDIVALRQVLYLCSMTNLNTSSHSSPQKQQSPAVHPPPPPPAASIAVPPPPAAAAATLLPTSSVLSPMSIAESPNSQFSSPVHCSTGNTTASNTSVTKLNSGGRQHMTKQASHSQHQHHPAFSLLPQPTPVRAATPDLSQLHSVVAKEIALISNPAEQWWVIELALPADVYCHPHYRPCPHLTAHEIPKHGERHRLKAMMSAESLAQRQETPASLRKVQSLTHLTAYDRRFETLMAEEAKKQGVPEQEESMLSFQPQQSPPDAHPVMTAATGNLSDTADLDVCASTRAEPYLRLYASKQNTKIWSHLVRKATLSNFGRRMARSSST